MDTSTESVASYNITDDRLKVWFGRRLDDVEYAAIRKAGFTFWHGSKCFTRVWSPEAEDLILSHGINIENDDNPDDTEARVERFSRYAERAEADALSAENRLASGAANTERRQRFASNRFSNEADKAAHWQRRIEASIRHANFKESPGLIARRIKGLESDLARWEYEAAPPSTKPGDRTGEGDHVSYWVGPSRGGRWVPLVNFPAMNAHANRWVAHIKNRLLYEQAVLASTDSLQAKMAEPGGVVFEVGGAIKTRGEWHCITKVNKVTIEYYSPRTNWCTFMQADITSITEVATKLRVDAGEIVVAKPPVVEKKAVEQETTRDNKVPEKLGAVGVSSSFSPRLEDQTWCVVMRVDKKTVELAYKGADGRYFKKKEAIRCIRFLKTAAEVAVELPELLTVYAEVVALKKRIAAKKAELKADAT